MNIKRNIIFALEARKKNGVAITENVPIRMRVNYSGQRIEFTMPYHIDAAKWDATKQRGMELMVDIDSCRLCLCRLTDKKYNVTTELKIQ